MHFDWLWIAIWSTHSQGIDEIPHENGTSSIYVLVDHVFEQDWPILQLIHGQLQQPTDVGINISAIVLRVAIQTFQGSLLMECHFFHDIRCGRLAAQLHQYTAIGMDGLDAIQHIEEFHRDRRIALRPIQMMMLLDAQPELCQKRAGYLLADLQFLSFVLQGVRLFDQLMGLDLCLLQTLLHRVNCFLHTRDVITYCVQRFFHLLECQQEVLIDRQAPLFDLAA